MSLLGRAKQGARTLRRGLAVLRNGEPPAQLDNQPHQADFEFQLPNPFGGDPFYRARISLTTTQHAHGETLRLKAHFDGCLRLPDGKSNAPLQSAPGAQALTGPAQSAETGLAHRGRQAAGGLARFGLSRVPAKLVAPILQQRLQTWIDIQASSAPLAAGAEALVPERLRGLMREVPKAKPGQPRIAGWAGEIDGPQPGVAQFMHMQLDQTDLPPELRGKPFNLTASVASTLVDESD